MNIKFQYNRIFQQRLMKEMNIRLKTLPILRAKESALRLEVKKRKNTVAQLERALEKAEAPALANAELWSEFGDIVAIDEVISKKINVAGVKILHFEEVKFTLKSISLFHEPAWIAEGRELLMKIIEARTELEIERKNLEALVYAGKKTTQKVNLYEKVQIPFYQSAVLKIKRFLEDEENLSKASQKIMKSKRAS